MSFRTRLYFFAAFLFFAVSLFGVVHADMQGSIDPRNKGFHYAKLLNLPGVGNSATDLSINFGRFTTQSAYDIHIIDDQLRGFAWGAIPGWILMNCKDVANGCSDSNGNFGVRIGTDGILSGYAWGDNAGWINFGPFNTAGISRVRIDRDGNFTGELQSAGYAWSEQFGWIVFDCGDPTSCVRTDYRPVSTRPTSMGAGGTASMCADSRDNDGDGLIDMADPECALYGNEQAPYTPPVQSPTTAPTSPARVPVPTVPSTVQAPIAGTPTMPIVIPPTSDTSGAAPFESAPIEVPDKPIVSPFPRTVPQVQTKATDFFRTTIVLVKDFFDAATNAIAQAMKHAFAKSLTADFAVASIVLVVLAVAAFGAIVPVAAGADIFLYPRYVMHNLKTLLGITPIIKPWGVMYDTATFQPVAMVPLTLRDALGNAVARTFTNPDGSFAFHTPAGLYTVTVDNAAAFSVDPTAQALFGPLYTPGQQIGVADNTPSQEFSIGIKAPASAPLSALQQFMVRHEVLLTNISLALFGIGALSAILSAIFYPSTLSVGLAAVYGVTIVLRGAGVFGSYASTLVDKATSLPLAGKLVRVFNVATKQEVTRTLTSRFGRAYVDLPRGYYYSVVSDPATSSLPGESMTTKPFVAHGGMHRQHFEL